MLDRLLNGSRECVCHVDADAVRGIVDAVRRWEDDTDESIRSALWEDAVEKGTYDNEPD
jgi:hypothetical protein